MVGMIDLNTIEEDETTPSSGSLSSPSSSSASALSASNNNTTTSAFGSGNGGAAVCLELWHACAGPLISLPKRGSVVVYFPQGHLEQLADLPLASYDLPPHVFCRVVDVKLHVSLFIFETGAYLFRKIWCISRSGFAFCDSPVNLDAFSCLAEFWS